MFNRKKSTCVDCLSHEYASNYVYFLFPYTSICLQLFSRMHCLRPLGGNSTFIRMCPPIASGLSSPWLLGHSSPHPTPQQCSLFPVPSLAINHLVTCAQSWHPLLPPPHEYYQTTKLTVSMLRRLPPPHSALMQSSGELVVLRWEGEGSRD